MTSISNQPFIARIANPEELAFVDFDQDRAMIDVPGAMLPYMPFQASEPVDEEAIAAIAEKIRARGYDSKEPITLEPRPGGRWLVDAHDAARFKAACQVADEMMTNLFGQKVAKVRFVLLASSYDGKFKAASNQLNYRAN
jgi:hypothetical protein